MTVEEAFGEVVSDDRSDALKLPMAVGAMKAARRHPDFTLIEARRTEAPDGYLETLIVEVRSDAVPSQNPVGIRYREPLALSFYEADRLPDVYAIRPDFPLTLHQNAPQQGGFKSLCLYIEPWSALRRTWTARKHLDRILWWLAETASGTLHRPDQPVEQLYFRSPFQFVVPPDFDLCATAFTHELIVEARQSRDRWTLVGRTMPIGSAKRGDGGYTCLVLGLQPVVHGAIEPVPQTLGDVHDQLLRRGAALAPLLDEAIRKQCISSKLPSSAVERTLIVVNVPIKRGQDGDVERHEIKGFVINKSLAELGVATGILKRLETKGTAEYWAVPLLGGTRAINSSWRTIPATVVEVVSAFTSAMARAANGITSEGPDGVFAGAGALGSHMLDLWIRSGWGRWTIIDDDNIQPHNLARHCASELHVGLDKALVVSAMANALTRGEVSPHRAIIDSAINYANEHVASALEGAGLVVDATTTLEFPRDLAVNPKIRRAVSVFLTPSGRGAVMLMEEVCRKTRLDSLEAQYYRHVISAPWGVDHLEGNHGHLWTGAGCRDVSAVIPNDYVSLHAASLAHTIRQRIRRAEPAVTIWHYEDESGSVSVNECDVADPIFDKISDLDIVWDEHVRTKLRRWREEHFPNETGGILLGYFDLALKRVFVVDALPAPPDSKEDPDGFVRGTVGLEAGVHSAQQRTGQIVGYVGEWHSHPPNHSSAPSTDDLLLLRHLAVRLAEDGQLPLMLIIGADGERWLTVIEIGATSVQ